MPRKKKKPGFDSSKITQEYINQVAEFYLSSDVSLRKVADEFKITILKARKILITAGLYESEIVEEIQALPNCNIKLNQFELEIVADRR